MVNGHKDSYKNQASNIVLSDCKDTQVIVSGDKSSRSSFPTSNIDDENSIVAFFLDTFNFKKLLEKIVNSQSRFKITSNFISLILMFFFLTFIFWQDDVLTLEKKSTTTTLMILIISAFLEFLGANTSVFKTFFDSEVKTKSFIDRLPFLSYREVKQEIRNQTFSPSCFNYFIEGLKDVNKYPQSVVYIVLDSQTLWKENLDLLFSPEIIKNISTKLIFRVLFGNRDSLTQDNMVNIYSSYSDNQDVIKMLIATQEYSNFLIKLYPEDSKLSEYYKKYQKEKKHLDWILKIIPINRLFKIEKFLVTIFLFSLWVLFGIEVGIPKSLQKENLLSILFITLVMTSIFCKFVLFPIDTAIYNYYYKHMLSNVSKK